MSKKPQRLDNCDSCVSGSNHDIFKCPVTKREGSQQRARTCSYFEYKDFYMQFRKTYRTEKEWLKEGYAVLDKTKYLIYKGDRYYKFDNVQDINGEI